MRHFFGWMICLGMAALGWVGVRSAKAAAAGSTSLEQIRFFEEKVRPLLVENCLGCHGEKKQKGGLRLDSPQGILKGGKDGVVVVPGKPAESVLIKAVSYQDKDLQMPPDGEGDRLSAEQVAVLDRWVEMGVPWNGRT